MLNNKTKLWKLIINVLPRFGVSVFRQMVRSEWFDKYSWRLEHNVSIEIVEMPRRGVEFDN